MSLFSALTIAVEGLNAQSTSINNVSNNISNAETVGL
jgi:flagellar hook protein FlgE